MPRSRRSITSVTSLSSFTLSSRDSESVSEFVPAFTTTRLAAAACSRAAVSTASDTDPTAGASSLILEPLRELP